jgi:hypothetical protein
MERDEMTDSITSDTPEWERRLGDLLPLFGHRNWIVVADSAYPAQSRPGIETIVAGASQIEVVQKVLRANVYFDKELGFVNEDDAPGILKYRWQLEAVLVGSSAKQLAHEEIIARLDQSAEVFRVLIIKTDMAIPYTSVFFELDCGYWPASAEQRLRQAMSA